MLFGEHSTMKVVSCRNEILNVHRHFDTNCGNSLIYSERAEWCFAATIGLQKKAGRVQVEVLFGPIYSTRRRRRETPQLPQLSCGYLVTNDEEEKGIARLNS